MPPRASRRLPALLLIGLIGGLTSGVPTHHHGEPGGGFTLTDAGHHGHGVRLVDQTERVVSELLVAALPAPKTVMVGGDLAVAVGKSVPAAVPAAHGQPPPSDRPRAPPVSA